MIAFQLGLKTEPGIKFYCNIVYTNSHNILVEEILENDINHRGSFMVSIDNKTKITNSNEENLSFSDLKTGNSIQITYDGKALETDPAEIKEVYNIIVIE